MSVKSGLNTVTSVKKNGFLRLPGLCRRLKRRRVTLLVEISNVFIAFFLSFISDLTDISFVVQHGEILLGSEFEQKTETFTWTGVSLPSAFQVFTFLSPQPLNKK